MVLRLNNTHETQRDTIFSMLNGLYSNTNSNDQIRVNSLDICNSFKNDFTPNVISNLLNRHYEYPCKGKTDIHLAYQQFFEKLGLLSYLSE